MKRTNGTNRDTKTPIERSESRERARQEAFVLLEVDPVAVSESPRIEHLFRGIGGQAKVLEFLAGSEEPEARDIVKLRARLTAAQAKAVPFEAYCVAAGVSTKKMFGIIAAEAADQSVKASQLLSKAMHPEVVKATIDNALHPLGTKDREMLHKAEAFLPIPKTSVTFIKGNVDARTQTQNVAVLAPVEDSSRRLTDRFNERMTIPAIAAPAVDSDEEEGDDD